MPKYDLVVSGRSAGGTDLIGRVLRICRTKQGEINILIEDGDKQENILHKLKKDHTLVKQVTAFDMPVRISLETMDTSQHSSFMLADYKPHKGI